MMTSPSLHDVVDFALENAVSAQRRREVMHEPDVRRVVEALALGENPGAREQLLDVLVALLREVRLLRPSRRSCSRPGTNELRARRLRVARPTSIEVQAARPSPWRAPRRSTSCRATLPLTAEQLDLASTRSRRWPCRAAGLWSLSCGIKLIDPHVELRALPRAAGDDQRRARLVDQDRVDLVDDRVDELALHAILGPERQVVAQIVEAELVVRAVGDVGGVGARASRRRAGCS